MLRRLSFWWHREFTEAAESVGVTPGPDERFRDFRERVIDKLAHPRPPGHLIGCEFKITRTKEAPHWEMGQWVCAPGCPVRSRIYTPEASAAAAMRYIRDRYRP